MLALGHMEPMEVGMIITHAAAGAVDGLSRSTRERLVAAGLYPRPGDAATRPGCRAPEVSARTSSKGGRPSPSIQGWPAALEVPRRVQAAADRPGKVRPRAAGRWVVSADSPADPAVIGLAQRCLAAG